MTAKPKLVKMKHPKGDELLVPPRAVRRYKLAGYREVPPSRQASSDDSKAPQGDKK